jgi:polyisoprenoid-binding protein YceI
MSTITSSTTTIPAGTYTSVIAHSEANFSVKYVVSTFRGGFEQFDAVLTADENGNAHLDGTVKVDSLLVKDENLGAHLKSPEFFDVEQHPEIKFTSLQITRDGDDITLAGDLTLKGHTEKVTGTGTISGPAEDAFGNTKIGLELTTVVDRTKFGLNWNAPLPKGGFALSNDVKLEVVLELVKA